jgi:hypothetical protein
MRYSGVTLAVVKKRTVNLQKQMIRDVIRGEKAPSSTTGRLRELLFFIKK